MLLHAGTHSANYDENTAATAFSFTVVAYQWGWNYYFPREIARLLMAVPRLAGRSRATTDTSQDAYAALLGRVRRGYLIRQELTGCGTAKRGRCAFATTLAQTLPNPS